MFIDPQQGVMILTGGLFLLAILDLMGGEGSNSTNRTETNYRTKER